MIYIVAVLHTWILAGPGPLDAWTDKLRCMCIATHLNVSSLVQQPLQGRRAPTNIIWMMGCTPVFWADPMRKAVRLCQACQME